MATVSDLCENEASLYSYWPNIFQYLLSLEREHTEEHDITLGNDPFVVEVDEDSKVLLESTQQVRLPCRYV